MNEPDFIPYESQGKYAGAETLIEHEWDYLEKHRKDFNRQDIKGIALSGGGIRSASFCLGVIQALAARNHLKKMDYLSTVSGGGYLGGSLAWLWSGLWNKQGDHSLGTGVDDFPYGTRPRQYDGSDEEIERSRKQSALLRHLRQHGNYLTPGRGINALSLLSILLRSIGMGFISLMVLSGLLFSLLYLVPILNPEDRVSSVAWWVMAVSVGQFVLLQAWYVYTIQKNRSRQQQELSDAAEPQGSKLGYFDRRRFEQWLPKSLGLVLLVFLVTAVHAAQIWLDDYAASVGGAAAAAGAILGALGSESKWRKFLGLLSQSSQLIVASGLMIFGLLVLSDLLVAQFSSEHVFLTVVIYLALSAAVLWIAHQLPINNISIHRYYRDRLMETFMPDVEKVWEGRQDGVSENANETGLHKLRWTDDQQDNSELPYTLINSHVVLIESAIAKFRGRGGDNFLLSPLYCGSNATGWRRTDQYCGGSITVPSAVAISGAAANPNTGVAGKGPTTNPVVSILMSIFNLRLGYWACNPDPRRQDDQDKVPNYLFPGFWEVIGRNNMNEQAEFVQLSDGGHFENLGLYELIRRQARLIICCDAAADADFTFADIANAIEKARVDFGALIDVSSEDLSPMTPHQANDQAIGSYAVAEQSHIVADITYADESRGTLVFIKTNMPRHASADLHAYKRAHPQFPDQTTADQFFDEVQFEAYRELGWQVGQQMLEDLEQLNLL